MPRSLLGLSEPIEPFLISQKYVSNLIVELLLLSKYILEIRTRGLLDKGFDSLEPLGSGISVYKLQIT